jgi:hypothetical protein
MNEFVIWFFGFLVLPFLVSAYAGVIVSRIYQFYDAKKDAWEIIISMEHKFSRNCHNLKHPWASARLNIPTQRIRYFGHAKAAEEIDEISTEIKNQLESAEKEFTTESLEFEIPRSTWEQRIVSIKLNWIAIFKPWPTKF